MDDAPCVHHIEVGVTNGLEAVIRLQRKYRFRLVATRSTSLADQWALTKNDTSFLVTCLKKDNHKIIQNDDYVIDWMTTFGGGSIPRKDSVFNVCLEVCDLDTWVERLIRDGVVLFKELQTVSDRFGSVKVCTIKSCVGDVYHTLVEKKNYTGVFLPGFEKVPNNDSNFVANNGTDNLESCPVHTSLPNNKKLCDKVSFNDGTLQETLKGDPDFQCGEKNTNGAFNQTDQAPYVQDWTTFDHVLFAVNMGAATEIIQWYERLFGMKKFLINREESPENGLVLSTDNVGLRLRAMEYWKCAEVGLMTPTVGGEKSKLFFVIAEGLPPLPGSTEKNQIESWIEQHRGPGIQHIAFNSPDIKSTVKYLKDHGVLFAKSPPPAYYTKVGRLQDIQNAGENADLLKEHGILIDTEADGFYEDKNFRLKDQGEMQENLDERYLLQIFTQPVFQSDPFFLEIIQREGATGFGSGNVAALYRSVQAYIVGQET